MASLGDAEVLWRRVAPPDQNADGTAKSSAFRTQKLSVHRAALAKLDDIVAAFPTFHVYEFTAGEARTAGASDVTDDKDPGDPPDHGLVLGISAGAAKRLRNVARRIVP